MQRDYSVDSGALSLASAGTAYYPVGIHTASTNPVDIVEVCVCCDATSAGSLKIQLVIWTSDGTGTGYTPKAYNGAASLVAANTSAKVNYSAAPTSLTVVRTWDFPLPMGPIDLELPLGREYTVPVSTYIGVALTPTTVTPNGFVTLVFEE